MRKNYLFSTTRQWNPGDEFILSGLLRIFRSIDAGFNPVIFNRNPEIKHQEGAESHFQIDMRQFRFKKLKPGFYDNSFKKELLARDFIDLVVFAGTPEWASARMKVLYDYIDKFSIPTVYLGIGVGREGFNFDTLDEKYKAIVNRSLLITVRDRHAEKALARQGAVYLPCPALMAAPETMERIVADVKKVGLIYMANTGVRSNKIDEGHHDFLVKFYKRILEHYRERFQFEFICHYIDELAVFHNDFPGEICHYSYDSTEYAAVYHEFDFVVGHRVHGIGMAASLGIPSIHIQHDVRADTCCGFMANVIDPSSGVEQAVKIFLSNVGQSREIEDKSRKLLQRKNEVFKSYVGLLGPVLQKIVRREN